jgi:hypothetical protein
MTRADKEEVPAHCKNVVLPDGIHEFHAYIDGGYCWAKVIHVPSGKKVALAHFAIRKGWKSKLFICLRGSFTKYRDKTPEQTQRSYRFYRSDFSI